MKTARTTWCLVAATLVAFTILVSACEPPGASVDSTLATLSISGTRAAVGTGEAVTAVAATQQAIMLLSATPTRQRVDGQIESASANANLRAGPSTAYPITGGVRAGQQLDIVARTQAGDWYLLADGRWIAAFLVKDPPVVPVALTTPPSLSGTPPSLPGTATTGLASTATPTPAITPTPTNTPAPTPVAEAVTPSPAAVDDSCPMQPGPAFAAAWAADLKASLGCPAGEEMSLATAYQAFEGGYMLRRDDTGQIYVLYGDAAWQVFADTWSDGEPEYACPDGNTPPTTPPTPRRGFGKIWCAEAGVRHGLGAAVGAEIGGLRTVEDFQGGTMLLIPEHGEEPLALLNSGEQQSALP